MTKMVFATLLSAATFAVIACMFQLPKLWAWAMSLTNLSDKWVKRIEDGLFWVFLFVVWTLALRAVLEVTQ